MQLPKPPKLSIKNMRLKRKQIILASLFIVIILCILAGFFIHKHFTNNDSPQDTQTNNMQMKNGLADASVNSGTLSSVTDSLNYELTLSTDLIVEDVCVTTGDSVIKGTALLTLNADSVLSATSELEDLLEDAENTLAKEQITYSEGMLDAKYQLLEDSEADNVAATKYKQKIQELKDKVSAAKEEYENAKKIKKNYPSKISKKETTLAEKTTQLSALENTLETTNKTLETLKNTLSTNEEKYNTANSVYLKILGYYENLQTAYDTALQDSSTEKSVTDYFASLIASAKDSVTEKEAAMTEAKSLYETAKNEYLACEKTVSETTEERNNLSKEIETLNSDLKKLNIELSEATKNLSSLKTAYQTAINNQITEAVAIENEYAQELLTSDTASSNYTLTVAELKKSLEEATDARDTVKENLEAFQALINNNQVISTKEGIVASIGYSAEDILTSSIPIISYSENILTTTVSVDQSDIGDLAVGDTCMVTSDNARCSGTISSISQATTSESISDVTFEVTVTLEDTAVDSGFTSGDSITVLFNMEMGGQRPEMNRDANNQQEDIKTTDTEELD